MNQQPQTIRKQFDPKSLPRWAQNHPSVVARCERDYAYRCDVFAASTKRMREHLIKTA